MKRVEKIAKKANSLLNASKIIISLPNGYEVIEDKITNQNRIFVAIKDNTLVQFLTDGELKKNESLEQHIKLVIDDIHKSVSSSPLYYEYDNFIQEYKEYKNNGNLFKIYVQDVLATNDHYSRMMSAFFLEPMSREFCQITVARGQYNRSERKLLKDISNLEQDEINKSLENLLVDIINRLTYVNN